MSNIEQLSHYEMPKEESKKINDEFGKYLSKISFYEGRMKKALGIEKGKFSLMQKQLILQLSEVVGTVNDNNSQEFIDALKNNIRFINILGTNRVGINCEEFVEKLHEKVMELEPSNIEEYKSFLEDACREISAGLKEQEYEKDKKGVIFISDETAGELQGGYKITQGDKTFKSDCNFTTESGAPQTAILNLYVIDNGMKHAVARELMLKKKFFQEDMVKNRDVYGGARGSSLERDTTERYVDGLIDNWRKYKDKIEELSN